MLHAITWEQYFSAMAIVLASYYITVAYKYFRWELLGLIGIKRIDNEKTVIPIAALKKQFTESNYFDNQTVETNLGTQTFFDELNAYLSEINDSTASDEILSAIENMTIKHPAPEDKISKHRLTDTVIQLVNQYFPNKILAEDIQHIIR